MARTVFLWYRPATLAGAKPRGRRKCCRRQNRGAGQHSEHEQPKRRTVRIFGGGIYAAALRSDYRLRSPADRPLSKRHSRCDDVRITGRACRRGHATPTRIAESSGLRLRAWPSCASDRATPGRFRISRTRRKRPARKKTAGLRSAGTKTVHSGSRMTKNPSRGPRKGQTRFLGKGRPRPRRRKRRGSHTPAASRRSRGSVRKACVDLWAWRPGTTFARGCPNQGRLSRGAEKAPIEVPVASSGVKSVAQAM